MRISRRDADTFDLEVAEAEAAILAELCGELRLRLVGGDAAQAPELRRLFPPAHPHDPSLERAYQEMVGQGLVDGRVEALDVVTRTVRAPTLTRDELDAWLRALNAVRLVLGTALDVSEDRGAEGLDDSDPAFLDQLLYDDLSAVVALIVHLLAER